jgi:hypothetical protein
MGTIFTAVICICLALAFVGNAQAHDRYSGLSNNGAPCCGGQDCRQMQPSDINMEDGTLYLRTPDIGDWVEVDPNAILPITSDDGKLHGCWWAASRIWGCVILPPRM